MRSFSALVIFAASFGTAFAQTNTASPVVGVLNYIHAVNDLDKTVAFYRAIGLEASDPRPFPNPGVPALTNAPGVHLRLSTAKIPNTAFGWELTDFTGLDRKPAQPRHTDPGAAALIVRVRDLDATLEAVKKLGAPVITRSGAPVRIGQNGSTRAILVRDPDGYIVDLIQPASPADASDAGNVLGASIGLTAANIETTLKFYRDLLGFDLKGNMSFINDKAIADLVGAPPNAQYREVSGKIPGTNADVFFYEWKGVSRTPFNLRVRDPGSPAVALRVTGIEALLRRLKAAGVKVISAKGELVQFSLTIRNIFVEDPNGFKIELYEVSQP